MSVDKKIVLDRVAMIREDVVRLKKMADMSLAEFKSDPDNYAVAEHHLRRASESVLDIGRHIIAKSGFTKATDYTQIIDILGENGVIPHEFAKEFRKIGGFRNRIVHMYWKVTTDELYEVIKNDTDKLTQYTKYIVKFIDQKRV